VPDDFFLLAAKGRQAEYRIQHRQRIRNTVAVKGGGSRHGDYFIRSRVAQALLRQEIEINIDHGTFSPDSTLPPVRSLAGSLQARSAVIDAVAGERRQVNCVKLQPNRNKRKGTA
jgi:hypothetical protein